MGSSVVYQYVAGFLSSRSGLLVLDAVTVQVNGWEISALLLYPVNHKSCSVFRHTIFFLFIGINYRRSGQVLYHKEKKKNRSIKTHNRENLLPLQCRCICLDHLLHLDKFCFEAPVVFYCLIVSDNVSQKLTPPPLNHP